MESPSNLAIGISLDTSQLRAQKELLLQEIKNLTRQMNAAGKTGNKTAMQSLATDLGKLKAEYASLDQEIRRHTQVTRESTAAHEKEAVSIKELGLEFGHLAHAVGLPIEGIKALKFGFAAFLTAQFIRSITEASNKISELVELGHETRFDTATIQAFSLTLERAGVRADVAKEAIKGFGETLLEQQKKASEARRAGAAAFADVSAQPGTTQAQATAAANAAQQAALGTASALERAGIYAGRFANSAAGMAQYLQAAAKYAVDLHRSSALEADLWTRDVFKKPYEDIRAGLEAAASGQTAVLAKQQNILNLTDEQKKANDEYVASLNEVTAAYDTLGRVAVETLARSIEGWKTIIEAVKLFAYLMPGGGFPQPSAETAARMPHGWSTNASGGYIRGAGSGTSDSILARLSNGEYVINAASTRRLGTGYLNALNNFAAGGLVSSPSMRFAAGGLASSAPGATVNLHLGGQVFATSASASVASALVTEAHRQAISSAGVKPSWFAGRPGA
jgi:hypothetical protein